MSETAPEAAQAVPLDKMARVYRRIRAQMAEVQKDYDTKMETLKEQQQTLKNAMKDVLLALGKDTTSVRTSEGTVVLSIKTRYNTQDWDSFARFVIEHEAVDLLEHRIHQTNMAQFLEANPGTVPPGLNAFSEYDISVRKPT